MATTYPSAAAAPVVRYTSLTAEVGHPTLGASSAEDAASAASSAEAAGVVVAVAAAGTHHATHLCHDRDVAFN